MSVSLCQATIYWHALIGVARAPCLERGRPVRHRPDCVAQPNAKAAPPAAAFLWLVSWAVEGRLTGDCLAAHTAGERLSAGLKKASWRDTSQNKAFRGRCPL